MNGMALLNTHSFIPGIFSINLFDPRCELVIVCGCKIYKSIVIDMRFGKPIHWNQFSEKKTLLTDFSTNFPPSVEAFFCCSTYSVLCLPIIDRPAIYVFYPCVELKSGSSARENCHDGNTTRCAFSSGYTRWNRSKRRWDWSKCCQTIKSDRKY